MQKFSNLIVLSPLIYLVHHFEEHIIFNITLVHSGFINQIIDGQVKQNTCNSTRTKIGKIKTKENMKDGIHNLGCHNKIQNQKCACSVLFDLVYKNYDQQKSGQPYEHLFRAEWIIIKKIAQSPFSKVKNNMFFKVVN